MDGTDPHNKSYELKLRLKVFYTVNIRVISCFTYVSSIIYRLRYRIVHILEPQKILKLIIDLVSKTKYICQLDHYFINVSSKPSSEFT